ARSFADALINFYNFFFANNLFYCIINRLLVRLLAHRYNSEWGMERRISWPAALFAIVLIIAGLGGDMLPTSDVT
ncbi:hypothetical protein D6779_01735, partial [Candidatus Parcubacteria bacterium]